MKQLNNYIKMRSFNNYIVEKLHIGKDIKVVNHEDLSAEIAKNTFIDALFSTEIVNEAMDIFDEWIKDNDVKEVTYHLKDTDYYKVEHAKSSKINMNDDIWKKISYPLPICREMTKHVKYDNIQKNITIGVCNVDTMQGMTVSYDINNENVTFYVMLKEQ